MESTQHPPEQLSLVEASRRADVSPDTVAVWCNSLGIGRKVDGAWQVDVAKLDAVIQARATLRRGVAQ